MDLRQLEYLVAVAEEANFTRAAQRVHVSQSGISARIKQLELELGARLFDRTGRVATLTVAGEAALAPAREALAAARAVEEAVGETNHLLRGRVGLGMVVGCTVVPLFAALAAFRTAHPGVEALVREGDSEGLVEEVRQGALDLALIGCAGRPPGDLRSLTIVSEGLAALVPRDHPLADRTELSLAELVAHPLVSMPVGTGLRAVLDRSCAAHGLSPAIGVQTSAADAIAELAARGIAVGVLSDSMAERYASRVRALPIRDLVEPAVLALVWRETPSPATAELVARCRDAFRTGPAA